MDGGKRKTKKCSTKKSPKKKGGALMDDVKNLAVPFAILLAKQGLQTMFDKKASKVEKKADSAELSVSARRKTAAGGSCGTQCAAAAQSLTGGDVQNANAKNANAKNVNSNAKNANANAKNANTNAKNRECVTTRQRHKSKAPAVVMHKRQIKASKPRSNTRIRCWVRSGCAAARIKEPPMPRNRARLGAPESVKPSMPKVMAMPLTKRCRGKFDKPTKIKAAQHS